MCRIIRGDEFDFYTDGVTDRVADVLAAADARRVRIASAYGEAVQTLPEWIAAAYGHRACSMRGVIAGNPAYAGIKAPTTIHHRYLLEDVPTGLVPLVELGRVAGLASTTLKSLAIRAESLLGVEVRQNERSLDSLGLTGLCVAEIRAAI